MVNNGSKKYVDKNHRIHQLKRQKSLRNKILALTVIAGITTGAISIGKYYYDEKAPISQESIDELKNNYSDELSSDEIQLLEKSVQDYQILCSSKEPLNKEDLKRETDKYMDVASLILKSQIAGTYNSKVDKERDKITPNNVGFYVDKNSPDTIVGYTLNSDEAKLYNGRTYLFMGFSDNKAISNYVDILLDSKNDNYDQKKILSAYKSLIKVSKQKCVYSNITNQFNFKDIDKDIER